jgi:hypothetical protein
LSFKTQQIKIMISILSNKRQAFTFVVSVVLSILLVASISFGTTYIDTDSVGIATATPGTALGVKGSGIFEGFVSAGYYTSTSTSDSWLLGDLGIGTTTPGTRFSVQGLANLGSLEIESTLKLSSLTATSTTATSTFSGGATVADSAGALGVGTTTPAVSSSLGVAGDAYFGAGATTTVTVTSNTSSVGGCIQLMHANSGAYWRVYIGSGAQGDTANDGLVVELGECQ